MGAVDVERQKPNVFRMKMLGAEVRPVQSGARTLKDAMNEALRDWVTNVDDTFYCIGTAAGPHPYPAMVRDFQCVIGDETRAQMQEAEGRLPDSLFACIGGGSNAIGLFHPFLDDPSVEMFGVEAAGHGLESKRPRGLARRRPARRAARQPHLSPDGRRRPDQRRPFDFGRARLSRHRPGTCLAQGERPRHLSHRRPTTRRSTAFQLCCRLEGIIPALEPAHALAKVIEIAPQKPRDHLMVVNLSGRGDKDIFTVAEHLGGM